MSKNFFPPHDPTDGRPGQSGDAEIRKLYGPRPGKKYQLHNSDDIFVEGWKFRFARPVLVPNEPKSLDDRRWLGFSVYFESPEFPLASNPAVTYRVAQVIRGMRIYKGRLYPPMERWAPGKYINTVQFNQTWARLLYTAIKQWASVMQYPEFGVDGVKNPVNTIAYSKTTVQMAMLPYTPGKKTLKPKVKRTLVRREKTVDVVKEIKDTE